MQFKVKIGELVHTVESTLSDESGCCAMVLDGRASRVRARYVSPNHLHLEVDGIGLNLFVARTLEGMWIWHDGRTLLVQDADLVPRRSSRGPADAACEVTPPTPATVMRLLVEVGQGVTKGQPLVVVSAMKMEMTLSAPYSGRVRSINTVVRAQVSPGDILVEIDPEPEGEPHE